MGTYDSRRLMLDSGRTALALRGLRVPEGHYPFIERFTTRRRSRSRRLPGPVIRPIAAWWRAMRRGAGDHSAAPA